MPNNAVHHKLRALVDSPSNVLVIHYACGDIRSGPSNQVPISCVAIRECGSGQIRSFGLADADVGTPTDIAERKLLDRLFAYMRNSYPRSLEYEELDLWFCASGGQVCDARRSAISVARGEYC